MEETLVVCCCPAVALAFFVVYTALVLSEPRGRPISAAEEEQWRREFTDEGMIETYLEEMGGG